MVMIEVLGGMVEREKERERGDWGVYKPVGGGEGDGRVLPCGGF